MSECGAQIFSVAPSARYGAVRASVSWALVRHRHTDYEDQLFSLELSAFDQDIDADIIEVGEYTEIKQAAHRAVDAFLDAHRKPD